MGLTEKGAGQTGILDLHIAFWKHLLGSFTRKGSPHAPLLLSLLLLFHVQALDYKFHAKGIWDTRYHFLCYSTLLQDRFLELISPLLFPGPADAELSSRGFFVSSL